MIDVKDTLETDVAGEEPKISQDSEENLLADEPDTSTDGSEIGEDSAEVDDGEAKVDAPDYEKIIEADLNELRASFPELRELKNISELKNPMRFAALRDLGLSAAEAYLATSSPRSSYDNRSHLRASVPGGAGVATEMSRSEYDIARDIFSELSDSEIRKLYRKVTNNKKG